MISINRQQIDSLSKQLNSKKTPGNTDTILYPIFAHSLTNVDDTVKNFSTYEMAHWTNFVDRWISNRLSPSNTVGYSRGTIILVDLGAENFGHEPSFTHPGIVLDQNRDSVLIAPCSSKKYGRGFPEIVDATTADGFLTNTGIQTTSIRWISKNRIISVIGTTSTRALNCIDTLILKSIPLHAKQILDKDNEITHLQNELKQLRSKMAKNSN